MKKRGIKKKFSYWFDNLMARGTIVMLLVLAVTVIALVAVITICIMAGGWDDEGGFLYTLWDVLATTINAWMPSSEDGSPQYVALIAISAVFGVLFTSFLIGIISSAVEEKLSQLRAGNSEVVEEGHTVVLGFKAGEYTLLEQIILSFRDKKGVIVVADECEKETMNDLIFENLDVPKNIKIICRNINIADPVALKCCSLDTASTIVVNPFDDTRTLKILLSVYKHFEELNVPQPFVITAVNQDEYIIPKTIRDKYGFTMLRTNDAVARIIAHSCTQLGLSEAFSEVFSFTGNELRFETVDVKPGTKFKDIFYTMEKAVPIGIYRNGQTILNPDRNLPVTVEDKFIVLEENEGDFKISSDGFIDFNEEKEGTYVAGKEKSERVVIIGSNDKLGVLVNELPEYVTDVVLAGIRHLEKKKEMCKSIRSDINYSVVSADVMDMEVLERTVKDADHVIILSDYSVEEEDSDARNIMLLLRLRDIKERLKKTFSITAEMCRDDNRNLIHGEDFTEFIVSSNMAAMVLAQIASNPALYDTFHELLSNEGNEFSLKTGAFLEKLVGVDCTVAEIRRELIHKHCILVGFIDDNDGKPVTVLNPDISKTVCLSPADKLIVIGE